MKRFFALLLTLLTVSFCCVGCMPQVHESTQIVATTWPIFQFTAAVCENSGLFVTQLVTGQVSCLHDYSLTVRQMQAIEDAELIIMSGCELEAFMDDALKNASDTIECCHGVPFIYPEEDSHMHAHESSAAHHSHADPHIWLDPDNAAIMVQNIARELTLRYPEHAALFFQNAADYCLKLSELNAYGVQTLQGLSCRELITFHDGFSYFASAFDLHILAALEEEDGAMATAAALEEMICLVQDNQLPAIFIETYGSDSAATVIQAQTGVNVYTLNMAMYGDDYFTAMRHNIDTVKEALR